MPASLGLCVSLHPCDIMLQRTQENSLKLSSKDGGGAMPYRRSVTPWAWRHNGMLNDTHITHTLYCEYFLFNTCLNNNASYVNLN